MSSPAGEGPFLTSGEGFTVSRGVRLSTLTTWRVGGPARYVIDVSSERALVAVVERARTSGLPFLVLGKGSNVLVSDAGFDGAVIRLGGELAAVDVEGEELTAGGGASLRATALRAEEESLSGLEFLSGIPGTAGGAVATNAGAFGRNTASVLARVRTVGPDGARRSREGFEDGYRCSLVGPGEIVFAATFKLRREDVATVKSLTREFRSRREASQPLREATAGSVFKNPPGEAAGRLLDRCGVKGLEVGGARVSNVHANFIVNDGEASAADIGELMKLMAARVRERFGIELEPEVRLVGFREGSPA